MRTAPFILALVVALVGCTSTTDGEEIPASSSADDTADGTADDTTAGTGGDPGSFVEVALERCTEVNEVFATLDPARDADQVGAVLREFVSDLRALEPPEDAAALEELFAALDGAIAAFEEVATADGPAAEERLQEAFGRIGEADNAALALGIGRLQECGRPAPAAAGGDEIPVLATEYAFDLPEQLPAGEVTFVMENAGDEPHLMELVRMVDGATFEQALEADPSEDPSTYIAAFLGESGTAAAGEQALLPTTLTPGRYALFCYLPAPDGAEHVEKGMVREFTVPS